MDGALVSHAVATMRGVQPSGLPVLRTAFLDAVATRPDRQGHGFGSAALRRIVEVVAAVGIGCLQADVCGFSPRLRLGTVARSVGGTRRGGSDPHTHPRTVCR